MTEETQTVVDDTETGATPPAEGNDARTDDLDSLLTQYAEQTGSPTPPPQDEAVTPDVKALKAEVETLKSQVQQVGQYRFQQDMADTVKSVKGDLDFVDNDMVEAWIDGQARKNEALQKAWLQRDSDPRNWQKIKTELGKRFQSQFSKMPDRAATEDREAVAAAVRGAASTRAPTEAPPNYARSSNAEFRNEVREKYGFDPGV